MTRRAVPWRVSEDAALRRLWAEGALVGEIAEELGRTPGSVQGRASYLGLGRRLPLPAHARRARGAGGRR